HATLSTSCPRPRSKGGSSYLGAPLSVASPRAADRVGGRDLALAQYPGAGDPRAGRQVRRRSRHGAARGLALSHGPGGGAAGVRAPVRPLRTPAGRAGGARARDHRPHPPHLPPPPSHPPPPPPPPL